MYANNVLDTIYSVLKERKIKIKKYDIFSRKTLVIKGFFLYNDKSVNLYRGIVCPNRWPPFEKMG